MSDKLISGHYKIVSLAERSRDEDRDSCAVGVNRNLLPFQPIRIGAPNNQCVLEREKDGDIIILRIGGYPYTRVSDDKVFASIIPEEQEKWRATYRKSQDAFTITLAKDHSKGWTVPSDNKDNNDEIMIRPIKENRSQYERNQLYRFELLNE